jgi:hypothetical protein
MLKDYRAVALKGFLAAASAFLISSAAYAEQNYACQHTDANGFTFEEGKWVRAGFMLKAPFFIKLGDETLDPQSVYDGLNVGYSFNLPLCFPANNADRAYSCASVVGETVTFNPQTQQGAAATTYGAGNNGDRRDDLVIRTFVCQPM